VSALLRPAPPRPPSAPATSRRYQSAGYRAKKLLLGPALRTSQLVHERISKRVALAVFSSDPISSTAYATEEILLVLVFAGAAATGLALPISIAIAGLLAILVASYRQIIKAYSSSGGAYVVSRDNFGGLVASIAGSALIIDYILTVAVSVAAGTAALTSAFHALEPWRVPIAVGFVVLLAWGNLRGLRESGRIFAVPTYLYVLGMATVVLLGIWGWAFGDLGPISYAPAGTLQLEGFGAALVPVSLFLLLHAFSAGVTALTGVEAISNGVSAFKQPEARNARTTLVYMATIMAFLFVGITFLATRFDARPFADGNPTLVAQLAQHVLGNPAAFIAIQVATLLILVLAANTSFSSFPLLASFAAEDAILPRQLRKRGHRLVYSNGILVLSAAAIFLVIAFRADTHQLIPLYAIGVVTSFTLSQCCCCSESRRPTRPRSASCGWRHPSGWPHPSPATRSSCCWRTSTRRPWPPCSTPANSTRCPSPPCTSPSIPTTPGSWPGCGPRCTSRSRWRSSTPPTATCSPPSRRPWPSGSAPTPRSPCWSPAAATSASGAGSCTTRPRPA
jgi:amino acid transporter